MMGRCRCTAFGATVYAKSPQNIGIKDFKAAGTSCCKCGGRARKITAFDTQCHNMTWRTKSFELFNFLGPFDNK